MYNTTNVIVLWNTIIQYGKYVRNNKFNGLDMWNGLKQILNEHIIELQWTSKSLNFYHDIIDLGVIEDKTLLNHNEWEFHHFFLQHGNIPFKNNGNNIRLFQIAYNIGQFTIEKINYEQKWIDYYNNNKLNEIYSFIEDESILTLNKLYNDELTMNVVKYCNGIVNNEIK